MGFLAKRKSSSLSKKQSPILVKWLGGVAGGSGGWRVTATTYIIILSIKLKISSLFPIPFIRSKQFQQLTKGNLNFWCSLVP